MLRKAWFSDGKMLLWNCKLLCNCELLLFLDGKVLPLLLLPCSCKLLPGKMLLQGRTRLFSAGKMLRSAFLHGQMQHTACIGCVDRADLPGCGRCIHRLLPAGCQRNWLCRSQLERTL